MRVRFQRTIQDNMGNVVPEFGIRLYEAGTTTLLGTQAYLNQTGSEAYGNAWTVSTGVVDFWVETPVSLDIGVLISGQPERVYTNVSLSVAGSSYGRAGGVAILDSQGRVLDGNNGRVVSLLNNGSLPEDVAEAIREVMFSSLRGIDGAKVTQDDAGDIINIGGTGGGGSGSIVTVNGDTGPEVSLGLSKLVGVEISEEIRDADMGTIVVPGPGVGEFLGFDEEGVIRNLPINDEMLGLPERYAPKDPNGQYLLYGQHVPLGGEQDPNLPDGAWVHNANFPDAPLYSGVHVVSPAGAAQTMPSPLVASRSFYTLTAGANLMLTFPPAPTTAGVLEIDVSIDQPPTGAAGTVTWPSNVRFDKRDGLAVPYTPVLETGVSARNTFRFRGALGVWECIGRWVYPGGAATPTPGPTPTFVNASTGNSGLSNTTSTVSAPYGAVVNPGDVWVGVISIAGSGNTPDPAHLAQQGLVLLEGPISNSDASFSLRSWLYKKQMVGNEDGTSLTVNVIDSLGAPATERVLIQGGLVRGGDVQRVSWQTLRDTTVDTTLDIPTITPVVANSLILAINTARHSPVAGGGSTPSTTITDAAWTERADHNEGRDSAVATYSGWVATRPISGGEGVPVPAFTGTFNITATHVVFVVAVAPVNV